MKKIIFLIFIVTISLNSKIYVDDDITLELHKNLKKIDYVNSESSLIQYLIYEFSEKYFKEKYRVDTLDNNKNAKALSRILKKSKYFKSRNKKGNEKFALSYMVFRAEYELLKKLKRDFNYSEYKNSKEILDIKKELKNSFSSRKIDGVLTQITKLNFSPLHFYYRPNSIVEQIKSDITKVEDIDMKPILAFSKKYIKTLKYAEKKYGVNWEIIVGILKKETNLGSYKLKNNPFEVIIPQLFYSINNPFESRKNREKQSKRILRLKNSAKKSLLNLIKYCLKNDLDPNDIKSNLVGAIGIPQFMPFNLHLVEDGNGDKKGSLDNIEDSIVSVGNFLKDSGWKKVYNLKKDRKTVIKRIQSYNLSSSYANGVYDIARKIEESKL
ncbi:MAG: hypothetical protein CR982_05045 [Candidatus Cloacimonadota bacterium]|nr:MAG: hypothetical protein CR982_05045 [Candidatus Cloacimonadota bacterium]PIE80534.1 MAG: hypothetical protein CSA15_01875 [Candidatus Delongbacteria bacterium]